MNLHIILPDELTDYYVITYQYIKRMSRRLSVYGVRPNVTKKERNEWYDTIREFRINSSLFLYELERLSAGKEDLLVSLRIPIIELITHIKDQVEHMAKIPVVKNIKEVRPEWACQHISRIKTSPMT